MGFLKMHKFIINVYINLGTTISAVVLLTPEIQGLQRRSLCSDFISCLYLSSVNGTLFGNINFVNESVTIMYEDIAKKIFSFIVLLDKALN